MTIDHAIDVCTRDQANPFVFRLNPSRMRILYLKSRIAHSLLSEESRLELQAGDASAYHARSKWRAQPPLHAPLIVGRYPYPRPRG